MDDVKAPDIAFSHIGIFVTDIARMTDFYARFLRFTVTDRGRLGEAEIVFLSRDPREHHQIVLAAGRPVSIPFNSINQISFRVDGLTALRQFHAGLKHEAVTDIQSVTHGNALSVYFRDPEGNRIELFLDTPWYVSQPMRVSVDLHLSDAALWALVEEKARTMPGFRPRAGWQAEMSARMGQL